MPGARVVPMDAITVTGLTKSYRQTPAVRGIDLSVGRGEVFALLGPNGAGKTTTVEILEGHRARDGGAVRVLDEDPKAAGRHWRGPGGGMAETPPGAVRVLDEDPKAAGRHWRGRIGIVLQSAADAAELTVHETVRHFAGYYPNPRRPDEVIEQVGLTGKANARVRTLSGGQRRRLDVALGVIGRPELIFLDEPTTGFDPEA